MIYESLETYFLFTVYNLIKPKMEEVFFDNSYVT